MANHMLSKAILTAAIWHNEQFDKGGKPYILHVLKVMEFLHSDDEDLNCIAVLHDIVEDTKLMFVDLAIAGFTKRVIDGVWALTKRKGLSKENYLKQILENRDAMQVKLCDLWHNMDSSRLVNITEKDLKRIKNYNKMYNIIKERI